MCWFFEWRLYDTRINREDLTTQIIKNSSEIVKLLERDNIKISEIDDIYPIADNDTPKLSSDRLEYSLSNALFTYGLLDIESIKEIYNDIEIQKNSENEMELGFKTKKIARKFVKVTSRLSIIYREDRTRYSMQFIADILKKLSNDPLVNGERISVICKIANNMINKNLSYDMNNYVYLDFKF